MSRPGNWAGPVSGTNFSLCSYGKFQPGYQAVACNAGVLLGSAS